MKTFHTSISFRSIEEDSTERKSLVFVQTATILETLLYDESSDLNWSKSLTGFYI